MSEMILGIGIDMVEVTRIEASVDQHGERFLERIFLPPELAYAAQSKFPVQRWAAAFALKEAVSKAFGTGIGQDLGWKDIELTHNEHGAPLLSFHGKGKALAQKRNVLRTLVSLSHTDTHAIAMSVLVGGIPFS